MTESKKWEEYKWPLSLSVGITVFVWLLLFVVVFLDPSKQRPLGFGLEIQDKAILNDTVSPRVRYCYSSSKIFHRERDTYMCVCVCVRERERERIWIPISEKYKLLHLFSP
jgi:hypothetical protein